MAFSSGMLRCILAGVGAFGQNPFRARLDAGFGKQQGEAHARPLAATHQAMAELDGRGVSGAIAGMTVSRALDKADAGNRWQPPEVVHGEDQRPLHHAVNQQLVRGRVDRGDTGMVTLIMQEPKA